MSAAGPLVSVVIPCFNAKPWIEQTLQSVAAQTHQQIEVIVVDDGSTDGSGELLDRLAPASSIRVFHQQNRGQTAALNRGLQEVRGAFVQYLDADDVLAPDKIERQLARLIDQPRAIASCAWGRFTTEVSETRFVVEPCWRDLDPIEWLAAAWHDGGGMLFPAMWLLPAELARRAGPWNEELSLNNDSEYFVRVLLLADRVLFVADARCHYRSGLPNSLSARRTDSGWRSGFRVIDLCEQHLRSHLQHEGLRRGLSLYWQRFAVSAMPHAPQIAENALKRGRALSSVRLPLEGGWRYKLLARVVGWRNARRLQRWSGRR